MPYEELCEAGCNDWRVTTVVHMAGSWRIRAHGGPDMDRFGIWKRMGRMETRSLLTQKLLGRAIRRRPLLVAGPRSSRGSRTRESRTAGPGQKMVPMSH
jgi:hypothetical protein